MRLLAITAALFLTLSSVPGQGQTEQKGPVRAKQPSVVNVEGRAEQVDVDTSRQDRSAPAKVGNGIRSGLAWTGRSVVRFTGWLMGTHEDIPSERQRRADREPETRSTP